MLVPLFMAARQYNRVKVDMAKLYQTESLGFPSYRNMDEFVA